MTPLTVPALHATAQVVDYNRLLAALSGPESNDNPWAIGAANERTAYQMNEETWKETTSLPWSSAFDPVTAMAVARKRLMDLSRILREHHHAVTAFNLARLWCPSGGEERAMRVAQLYEAL